MGRRQVLLVIAVAGVLAGYGVVRLWPGPAATPVPAVTGPAVEATTEGSASTNRLPPLLQGGGSSISVVGGMTRKEMVRRGLLRDGASPAPPTAVAGAGPATAAVAAGGTRAAAEQWEGPPAAHTFPPDVQARAKGYLCLCGCSHILDVCPCNDQPVGAVTMLTYLQSLMSAGRDEPGLDEGMVDRYGPRVLVQP